MNITTEPIRDMNKVKEILEYLKGDNGKAPNGRKIYNPDKDRNYVMAKVQLNTALRISDVLKLRVCDFIHPTFRFKTYLTINEKKTGKEKMIEINSSLEHCIKEYILHNNLELEHYLFSTPKHRDRPISNTQAHRIYQEVGKALNIPNFNSHSLRKTWGYNAYKKSKDLAIIMEAYNHTDMKETLKYIGVTQEDVNNLYKKLLF